MTMKKGTKVVLALALCIGMLMSSMTSFMATETVYDSKSELFSAMRKALLKREKIQTEFYMTDRLRDELCYYDELFHQYFVKDSNFGLLIFDFNGDQMGIPANEGDYLQGSMVGFSSIGNINSGDWGTTIDLQASSFMTTAAQESEFEGKLKKLFVAGGALESAKKLGKADAVVACMDYINKNVKSLLSYEAVYHTAYGALCKGQATCQGKAMLLYRMLRELGIANRILMGVDAAAHTYNIVLIDGKYYYCDPSTSTVILKGSKSFKPAALQERFQTDAFKAGVLSKLSASDYPLKSSNDGSQSENASQGGNTSQGGSSTQKPNTHTHSFSKTYNSDKTNHWYACSCGEVNGKEKHVAGDWVVDKAATLEAAGSQSKKCTKCGYLMETKEIPKLTSVEYEVLDGAESTYQPESQEFSLRAAGEIEKFVSVEVDGKVVDPKYYTVKEGSTIIIFTKEFMDSLGEGEHVVKFNFTDGTASANIKVANKTQEAPPVEETESTDSTTEENKPTTNTPDTNVSDKDGQKQDGMQGFVWIMVVLFVVAGAAGGFVWYKKKQEEEE